MAKEMTQTEETQSRPRLAGKRLTELLDIAAEVFIADGFQAASINVIAKRAGASKASLYSRYRTKEDLFLAVLEQRMNDIFQHVTAAISEEVPVREALLGFGVQLLQSAHSDSQIALIRMVSMEADRFPQLGRKFFELGPQRGLAALSGYFSGQIRRGMLRAGEPQIMAQHFLGMVAGGPLFFRLLGITSYVKAGKQRSRHLETAIDAFLAAYGPIEKIRPRPSR